MALPLLRLAAREWDAVAHSASSVFTTSTESRSVSALRAILPPPATIRSSAAWSEVDDGVAAAVAALAETPMVHPPSTTLAAMLKRQTTAQAS